MKNFKNDSLLGVLQQKREYRAMDRRRFLAAAGLTTGAAMAAGCSSSKIASTAPYVKPSAPSISLTQTEQDVLNFALNLEYLEANFYYYVATGAGLPSGYAGASPGAVTGGSAKITFTDVTVGYLAIQLANDELGHVLFIQSLLSSAGATPVSQPALNLAALGTPTDDASFLAAARQLETVGTSAYEGGIGAFVTDPTTLAYAATIHTTEGEHEGLLRQYCIAKGIVSPAVDGLDIPPTAATLFNTNSNGLNAVRTPSQVLQIVYGAPGQTGVTSGGFYPSGMNGNIVST